MATTNRNVVEIDCTPQQVYAYVTQPWRWHEWHPSSRSASAAVETLAVGDEFDEEVELQPLSPLPLKLRRRTRYRVLDARPAEGWEVRGQMRDGWLQIRYEFEAIAEGTRFVRTLSYDASGASRVLLPLLRRRTEALSAQAMANLKRRLEGVSS